MRAHLESLPRKSREVGSRLTRTYRDLNDARIAYGNLGCRRALSLYLRAVRRTPSVLGSPLMRSAVTRGLTKAILGVVMGERAVLLARRAKRTTMTRLGRDVEEVKAVGAPTRPGAREDCRPGGDDILPAP